MKSVRDRGTSANLFKSMSLSLLYKPIGIIISYVYTPILIAYLGDEKYGVWATLLSVISWISYFDVGIGNGLRNIIAKDIADENYHDTKVAVSTAYTVMTYIISILLVVALILGGFLNWNVIFHTGITVKPAVLISFTFICVNFLLSLQKVEYYAIQKAEKVALLEIFVQTINLIGVCLFSRFENDQLLVMSVLFGLSSFVVNITYSITIWKKYNYLKPNLALFDRSMFHDICGLGFKFFFLQISALILFTTDNLIITTLYGPKYVTPYSTVNKVFNIFSSLFAAMITPLWSRYTVAKANNDYLWIKKTLNRMRLLLIPLVVVMVGIVFIFQPLSDWWLGTHLTYENGLVITMAAYVVSYMYSTIYGSVMNGMGNVNLQVIVATISAVINIPLSFFFAEPCGLRTVGVCFATLITMVIGNIIYTVYTNKVIKEGLRQQ